MNLCAYCGCFATHSVTACPAVAEIDYYPDGTIKRIVKRGPLDYWRAPAPNAAEQGEAK